MGKATITIKHGQSQSFSLTEGSNVNLAPSSDGKGVVIGVKPSPAWVNPGRATTEKDGLLTQLPDDATKFLNGKGEWTVPNIGGEGNEYSVFSNNNEGLVPAPNMTESTDNQSRWLRADGKWTDIPHPTTKRYRYREVPHIIINNIAALKGSNFNSFQEDSYIKLTCNPVHSQSSLIYIDGHPYYYAYKNNGGNIASIFVYEKWCDKFLYKRWPGSTERTMTIMAGKLRAGKYGVGFFTQESPTSDKECFNIELVNQFPNPTIFLNTGKNSDGIDIRESGNICGWCASMDKPTSSNPAYVSYSALPFQLNLWNQKISPTNKEDARKYPWLIFGTFYVDKIWDHDCTLSFSTIIEEEVTQ